MTLEAAIRKRAGKSFLLDVEFNCDGTRLGILGPSGCGKTMILKCIAGVETPESGRIVLNGRVLFDSERGINLRPQDRRVGMLFQDYALFPRMTVRENIGIGAKAPAAEKKRLVAELLGRFQLDGLEGRFPEQLSGGQRQRVALARMLAAGPEIVLLDEPFSALDAHLRERMQLRLREILDGFPDSILVTHDRDEAYRLCPELMVLDGGCVLARGTARGVFGNPGSARAARLTGCKNISRLEKIGERSLYAVDWGVALATAVPVSDAARFVGIRAHDLVPVFEGQADADNAIAVKVRRRVEDPFEWNIVFANAGAGDSPGAGDIWWKVGKRLFDGVPSRLRMPPESLLLLTDDMGE